MKKSMNYFLLGLFLMILATYLMGLSDDAFQKTGVWYKDILGSFKYYILWVLPYWWLLIVLGAIFIGIIVYGIKIGIEKFK